MTGLLALLLLAVAPAAPVRAHVVVVGVNTSLDEGTPPLSYADDDAARFAELFRPRAASLRVLAVLDSETQALFPDVAAQARAPSSTELRAALTEAFADVKKDRDAGLEADFHFVYVGHGAVAQGGEGYVSLLDEKLTRTALFDAVLAPSPARFNHVIVDACAAYHLLYRGGGEKGAQALAAVAGLLEAKSLARHPNTGVLLATSSAKETHEWSRIRGGVFSHEVMSALAGAADVDGDRAVSYAEVGAFIEAANAGVTDPRARVDFTLRPPPLFTKRPLATLAPRARTLAFAATDEGRFLVEDGRGVTVAELHKNGEQKIDVELRGPAPWRVKRGDTEWLVPEAKGNVAFKSLKRAPADLVASRSAVTSALEEGLFQVPFGRSWVAGYSARLQRDAGVVEESAPGPAPTSATVLAGTTTAVVASALGVGALVAGGISLAGLSSLESGRGKITALEAQRITDDTNTALVATALLGAGALVVGGTSAVLLLAE